MAEEGTIRRNHEYGRGRFCWEWKEHWRANREGYAARYVADLKWAGSTMIKVPYSATFIVPEHKGACTLLLPRDAGQARRLMIVGWTTTLDCRMLSSHGTPTTSRVLASVLDRQDRFDFISKAAFARKNSIHYAIASTSRATHRCLQLAWAVNSLHPGQNIRPHFRFFTSLTRNGLRASLDLLVRSPNPCRPSSDHMLRLANHYRRARANDDHPQDRSGT